MNKPTKITGSHQKGLYAYFEESPGEADLVVFGPVSHADRRGFLRGTGLATMGALLGAAIPFHPNMPSGVKNLRIRNPTAG